jgi:Reversibly glycosylated polypeptide
MAAPALPGTSMTSPSATLVLTSIFEPKILEDYLCNFRTFGHLDQVQAIVIADRKTPQAAWQICRDACSAGLRCHCPSLDEQEAFLRRVGIPSETIPYDSDNRRNIGFLMALENGSDFMASIDDDNFCLPAEDYFAAHAVVTAAPEPHLTASSATGFLNICELLDYDGPARVYPRGFPYRARHEDERWRVETELAEVHVNAGLWLRDPDVDAMTWLVAPARVTGFRERSLVLAPSAWSPVNSQNTALRRAAIPAYYFIRMGYSMSGMPIDRYGDIFSGYFTEACTKHLGGAVRFGSPVAEHRRNSHNYIKDASREWACILTLEDLLPWMVEAKLSGDSYLEAYLSLSHLMEDAVERFQGTIWTDTARGYFHQVAHHMRAWLKACRSILN